MILAAHQPQYLAWPGYYHKMAQADVFVYLDDVQYKKREFQNRNRIKSSRGELWLTVPVITKGRYLQKVRDVEIDSTKDWSEEHLKSLTMHYAKAPHLGRHMSFFRGYYGRGWTHLLPLCLELDGYMREQLGIVSKVFRESEIGSSGASTERLISICRRLGADAYISGQGGKGYLDEASFDRAGIRLLYQTFHPRAYSQLFGEFLPGLSAVDMLLNCGSQESARILSARDGNMLI